MARRSSLNSLDVAIDRVVDTQFDKIEIVADKINEVETVANIDINQLTTDIQNLIDFTDITVNTLDPGLDATWDKDNKILSVPKGAKGDNGIKGDKGDSVYISNIVNNSDNTITILFSDGTVHTTNQLKGNIGDIGPKGDTGAIGPQGPQGLQGPQGDKGDKGQDAIPLTITSITNNNDDTITINFSDGYTHITDILKGNKGDQGDQGRGITNIQLLSDTGDDGFRTYRLEMSDNNDEYISVRNGKGAYKYALDGGYEGTEQQFTDALTNLIYIGESTLTDENVRDIIGETLVEGNHISINANDEENYIELTVEDTNLSTTYTDIDITINSSTGDNTVINEVTETTAGILAINDKIKLNRINLTKSLNLDVLDTNNDVSITCLDSKDFKIKDKNGNTSIQVSNIDGEITINNNVTLPDNVTIDGRNISEDGTKLDLISVTSDTDLDTIRVRVNELDAAVVLQGTWDASSDSFPSSTNAGQSWIVNTEGIVDSIEFKVGDRLIAIIDNASTSVYTDNWLKLDYTDKVTSVAGKVGAVILNNSDVGLENVLNETQLIISENLNDISDKALARANLGVEIGKDVQAYNADIVIDSAYIHTDNNFTTTYKDKLDGIENNAQVNIQSDWSETDIANDAFIKNKPEIPDSTSDLTNDSGFITAYLDTTNFNGILSSNEDTIQKAIDKLDDITLTTDIESLTNVTITNIEDGQLLSWDTTNSKWINTTLEQPNIDEEAVRDTIASSLIAGDNITINVNDDNDTITIASSSGNSDSGTVDGGLADIPSNEVDKTIDGGVA